MEGALRRQPGGLSALRRPALLLHLMPHLVAVLTIVLVGWPTLSMPLHSDHATFVLVGRSIAEGGVPYVDTWDVKTPGVFFVYAAAIQGPFDVMRNVRAFDLVWVAVTSLLLYEVARRWWNSRAALCAALIYGVVSVTDDPFSQRAQPDSLLALPLALALLLYEVRGRRRTALVFAGIALGFGVHLRFAPAFWLPVLPLVEALGADRGRRIRTYVRRFGALLAGFVAANLLVFAYLAAVRALGEFVTTMHYAGGYTRLGGPWNPADGPTVRAYLDTVRLSFPFWAFSRPALTLPPLVGAVLGLVLLRDRRVAQLALLAVGSYVCIAMQAKFFWYHFGHMVPILALLGGWTWAALFERARERAGGALAWTGTVIPAAALLLMTPPVLDNALHQWTNHVRYHSLNDYDPYAVDLMVARHIRERTDPEESISVWGFDPLIYVLSDRPHASRFIVAFPLMSDWAPPSWRQGFIEELHTRRPAYIVVERGPAGSWFVGHNVDKVEYLQQFPELQRLLAETYVPETEISDRILYRRRE